MSGSLSRVLTVMLLAGARLLTLSGAATTGWSGRNNTETHSIIIINNNNRNSQTEMTSRIGDRPQSYQVDRKQTGSFYHGDFRHGKGSSAACGASSDGGCLLLLRNRQSITLELVTPPHSESYNCIKRNVQRT